MSTSVASVPEPSALSLLVVGLGGVIALRRVRRKAD
ncbi:MAG: PEP-CTERM sorting domain-containing protein [Betaproteobacteria bacterium]|nr:PEP-CTERM sorting domain-containing protein [Betaproteobacteria bacterium]